MAQRESGGAEWMRHLPAVVGGFVALIASLLAVIEFWQRQPSLVTSVILVSVAVAAWVSCAYVWSRGPSRWRTLTQVGLVVIPVAVVGGLGYALSHSSPSPATPSITAATSAAATEGLATFDEAVKANPQSPRPLLSRANAYYEKNMADEALRDVEAALKLAPNDPAAHFMRGNVYFYLKGDMGQAIESYTQTIAFQPGNANAYSGRGEAYARQGDHIKAIADFTSHIKLTDDIQTKPAVALTYIARAKAYELSGDIAKAIADYKTVVDAVKDGDTRQQAEAHLKRLGAQ